MYRSRPEGSIDRGILNYVSSLKDDFAIFLYDIIESEAHVIMLHEIGYLSRGELVELLQALEQAKLHPKSIMKKTKNAGYLHSLKFIKSLSQRNE